MSVLYRICAICLATLQAVAAEHHGTVKFGGLPVPGASVSMTQGDKKVSTITDQQGAYSFPDLTEGVWKIEVEMQLFMPIAQEVAIAPGAPSPEWELKLLPMDQIKAQEVLPPAPAVTGNQPPPSGSPTGSPSAPAAPGTTATPTQTAAAQPQRKGKGKNGQPAATNTAGAFQRANLNASANAPNAAPAADSAASSNTQEASELSQRAADGFLVNGSTNNGASSPFALNQAFGNFRGGPRSLYNGNVGVTAENSALNARQYSITGQDTPKPDYSRLQGFASFGGPLRIPHLIRNGPNFFIGYQWLHNRTATTQPGLMPTEAERNGDFSGRAPVIDPLNGNPFANNIIPQDRISPQARALLGYYPMPNLSGSGPYNYQIPIVGITHQDSLQGRFNRAIGRKNQVTGSFGYQNTRSDTPNLFGFLDNTAMAGVTAAVNWRHTFSPRVFGTAGYQFSRMSIRLMPFFANRENVAAAAGITGNNQDPLNWGPPTLAFASGISGLSDVQASTVHNQTSAISYSLLWNRRNHNFTFGGDYKRQQFNSYGQQDPRGTFTFNGTTAGNDFGGFLLGIPDTSSIAFGNADKYFRSSSYDAFFTDDWRVSSSLTFNPGVRWEYSSPITELYGRLVNLDIAPGFTGVSPVVANNPVGSLTGTKYPDSLVHPDKMAIQPRIGFAWRPIPASSLVVRGGYGVYYNTSVYQSIASQMAQQAPLSTSLNVQNSATTPLTLANGFTTVPGITPTTFAIDPHFQIGYSQDWQVSVQKDLPLSLVMMVSYLGTKGTRGMQEFLPNTYPTGAVNPCPSCPSGFVYLTSNGNSTREAGQIQLRRRLHNGFTASLQYTYAKAIDDAYLGGRPQSGSSGSGNGGNGGTPSTGLPTPITYVLAQDWLNLSGERGLSNFDQRHQLSVQAQYTTGMGVGGGTLMSGWRGALFKEWTIATQITAATGMPLTPSYQRAVNGTGFTGTIRPDYTGASVYDAPAGHNLNVAAYTAPAPGQWGNAARNSITGPGQFTLNASFGRTFAIGDRRSADLIINATNALNHVTYPSWVASINSSQFGLPLAANAMRSIQTTLRVRF